MAEGYWDSIEYSCVLLNVSIVLFALLLYYKFPIYRVIRSGCDKFFGEEMQRKCDLMVHVKINLKNRPLIKCSIKIKRINICVLELDLFICTVKLLNIVKTPRPNHPV